MKVPTGLKSEWITSDPAMAAEDGADVLMNRCATPRWYFTMRQMQARVVREAPRFALPMLCLVGEADVVADPGAALDFFKAAGSLDKSFYSYRGRVHELFREVGRQAVFDAVLGWIRTARRPARLCAAPMFRPNSRHANMGIRSQACQASRHFSGKRA